MGHVSAVRIQPVILVDTVQMQQASRMAFPMQHLNVLVLKTAIALPRLTLATQLTQYLCVHVVQIGQIILYVT